MDTEKIKDVANRISEIRKFISNTFSSKENPKIFAYGNMNQFIKLTKIQALNFKSDLLLEIKCLENELKELTCTKK